MTGPVCNLCGCREFDDINGRVGMRCVDCRSLERTRLLFLYLQRLSLPSTARVLHIAPERGIYRYFQARQQPGAYIPADFNCQNYRYIESCRPIDLCDLSAWPSDMFDLILHSHVLEHCAAPLGQIIGNLHRMLRPTGRHMFIIPIGPGRYDEAFEPLSKAERIARFEQHDHMRRFGEDDLAQSLGRYLRLPAEFDATADFSPECLAAHNIPRYMWRGFQGATIFNFTKSDCLGLPLEN